jgi:hypothetical protein
MMAEYDSFIYRGVTFHVGEQVLVEQPDNSVVWARIIRLIPLHELASVENEHMRCSYRWSDMARLNPHGGIK